MKHSGWRKGLEAMHSGRRRGRLATFLGWQKGHLPLFSRGRRAGAMTVWGMVVALVALLAPGAWADDNSQYPSDPASRTFTGGPAGWTSSSEFDGVCVPPLLCPTVTNAYTPSGDADGNGYISSDYLGVAGVSAVAGTTTGVWHSPPFVYSGSGKSDLAFTMSRRADVAQLLAVAGSSAEYSVALINVSEGDRGQALIAPRTLAGADAWTPVPAVSVKASRLNPGDTYKLEIITAYKTGTSVLVTASSDYDNVVLGPDPSSVGGGNGKGSGKGNGNGDDRNSLSSTELLSLFRSGVSGRAVIPNSKGGKAKRLMVKVRCPRKIGRACRVTGQGLLRKRKPATAKRTVRVPKGKTRKLFLKVKPKFRRKVAKRKRLLVKEKVKAGKATATVYKSRKLIRR